MLPRYPLVAAARLLVALVLALGLGTARAQEAPVDDRRPFDVVVEGAGRYADTVRRNLSLVRRSFDEREASRERLERYASQAREEAADILATEGYYSPQVKAEVREAGDKLVLAILVELGEPVRVVAIDLRFAGDMVEATTAPNPQSARNLWPLREGEVFTTAAWEAAKRALLRHIAAERYAGASLAASRADVDPERREARLFVEIASGPVYRFGEVRITGLARYRERVIGSITRIAPGTEYSQALLSDLQTRLQSLPYFSAVSVFAPLDESGATNTIPVRVDLVEAQSQRLQAGVGYSTNFGVRGQLTWDDNDLFDRALRWRNLFKLDNRETLVTTGLGWPPRSSGWANDLGLTWRRTDISGLRTQSLILTPAIVRLEPRLEQSVSVIVDFSREQPDASVTRDKLAVVPTYSWRRRAYDDLIDPRDGWELFVQVGVAAKAALSDQNFFRAVVRAIRLIDLGPRNTLGLRADFGWVLADSRVGVPQQFLFRAGGDQSLRGYRYQSIGVREGDATVGGRYLAVLGAEHIHWFRPQLGGALFYEVGDAFDQPTDRRWRQGFGIGVRYRSPVGPINVDLAYGQATREVRLHVSLGLAF